MADQDNQLLAALKAKFRSPQDAMKALGLDAALLEVENSMATKMKLSPAALAVKGAMFTYLYPRLAVDSKKGFNFSALVQGVTSKNYAGARGTIVKRVARDTRGKLAQDADIEDLAKLLNALKPEVDIADEVAVPPPNSAAPPAAVTEADAEPDDTLAKIKAYLEQEGVSADIINNLDALLATESDLPDDAGAPPGADEDCNLPGQDEDDDDMEPRGGNENDITLDEDEETEEERKKREAQDDVTPLEQDDLYIRPTANGGELVMPSKSLNGGAADRRITRATMDKAIKTAQDRAVKNQRAIRDAERYVRPWVGDLALDANSAADIYRTTLKVLGVKGFEKMHADALRPVLDAQPKPTARIARDRQMAIATDAKVGDFASRWGDSTANIRLS